MAKKILFIGGTRNQTTMVHTVARELGEYDCWFTPFYGDGLERKLAENGMLEFTILGRSAWKSSMEYFQENDLQVDARGEQQQYDLIVTATDLLLAKNILDTPIILVQEGMLTPENWVYKMVRTLGLPRYIGNTSMTGLSHAYQKFCVASEGFRDIFIRKGANPDKIEVTGIPNFDRLDRYFDNDFPYHDYVLGATSYLRESWQYENRPAFIRKVLKVADGRQVIFKLHPSENHKRAIREIEKYAPEALIFTSGDINPMIANCAAMVTKFSTVLMVALALDKPVYSDLDPNYVNSLRPIQNGGTSGKNIAEICREFLK